MSNVFFGELHIVIFVSSAHEIRKHCILVRTNYLRVTAAPSMGICHLLIEFTSYTYARRPKQMASNTWRHLVIIYKLIVCLQIITSSFYQRHCGGPDFRVISQIFLRMRYENLVECEHFDHIFVLANSCRNQHNNVDTYLSFQFISANIHLVNHVQTGIISININLNI